MKYVFICFVCCLFLWSCFKDEGNYDYVELNPPTWLRDYSNNPYSVVGYQGENVELRGSKLFIWGADSATRKNEVRYEWKFDDVVVSEELDVVLPAAWLKDTLGLDYYSTSVPTYGTFSVIDKATGVSFQAKLALWLYSAYVPGDWVVLYQRGDHTELATMRDNTKEVNGETVFDYTVKENMYESINGSSLPGLPVQLTWSKSLNVGSQGSWTVVTDQVAYELNAEDLVKANDLKDLFLDGTPENFVVTDRRDKDAWEYNEGPSSFIATKDGRVFTRKLNENYMGGQFLTEPYYIDEKGYKITKFYHAAYSSAFPCYDEKNRRVVIASTWKENIGESPNTYYVYRTNMVALSYDGTGSYGGAQVSDFPEGTIVYYMSENQHLIQMPGMNTKYYTIYYKLPDAPYPYVGDFAYNEISQQCDASKYMAMLRWHGVRVDLNESSVFMMSAATDGRNAISATNRDFFSVDNKLYWAQRGVTYADYSTYNVSEFMNGYVFDSNITALAYDLNNSYTRLVVGCENGEIYIFDISVIQNPQLIYKTRIDGKIAEIKQLLGANARQRYDCY